MTERHKRTAANPSAQSCAGTRGGTSRCSSADMSSELQTRLRDAATLLDVPTKEEVK
jgi:hypothetical protein